MTRNEWELVSYVAFTEWWDQPQDARRREVWFEELKAFGVGDVERALRNLLMDSPKFAPKLGEVINELRPKPPAWEEVWPRVSATLGRVSPTYRGEEAALQAVRAECGERVAAWVAVYGARRLSLEPVFALETGGIVEARLRRSFMEQMSDRAACDRAAVRLQHALCAETIRELEVGDEKDRV